jgi:hypothetical protein
MHRSRAYPTKGIAGKRLTYRGPAPAASENRAGEMVGFHAGEGVGAKLLNLDAMIPPEDFEIDQVGSALSRRVGQVPVGEGPLPQIKVRLSWPDAPGSIAVSVNGEPQAVHCGPWFCLSSMSCSPLLLQ